MIGPYGLDLEIPVTSHPSNTPTAHGRRDGLAGTQVGEQHDGTSRL
jgi:hypothetical protein